MPKERIDERSSEAAKKLNPAFKSWLDNVIIPNLRKQLAQDFPSDVETQSAPGQIMPAFVRLKDAATYTGLSEQMLLKLTRIGEGPPRIRKGRAVLYSIRALDEWMNRDREE